MGMRALVSRKLSASGYSVGQKLRFRGVEAICVIDPRGKSMLMLSNLFYGPSWAQIHKAVEEADPALKLVSFGATPSVLTIDSAATRQVIASVFNAANSSRGKQVHLEGVGFVQLESKAKPDMKRLALPLISLTCVAGLGIVWGNSSKPIESLTLDPVSKVCIVDSTASEFQDWLIEALKDEKGLSLGSEVLKSTAIGELNVVIETTIGSAAKVTGTAVCDDGRERLINHRIDTSGSGDVLELGQ